MFMMVSCCNFNLGICIILSCLVFVFSFNLDISTPIIHSGPEDSYFGFSLSGYSGLNSNWLIIGAPKAQTNQSDVKEGGSVYKCSPSQSNSCTRLVLDRDDDGNERSNTYKNSGRSDTDLYQFDEKSYQLFGSTIETSKAKGGPLLVCAPKYTWIFQDTTESFHYPIGKCFAVTDDLDSLHTIKEYTPCYPTDHTRTSRVAVAYCQAGFSASIPKEATDGDHFLLGALGASYYQGKAIKLNFDSNYEESSYIFPPYGIGPFELDFNYKAYSVAYINMQGNVRYVVGAPRAEKLLGKVTVLFNTINERMPYYTFKGDQLGAYFGQSLAVVDLNGDGHEDLVVSAPMYAQNDKWESGCIYIYYQDLQTDFKDAIKIIGHRVRSRLGYSLAALGDINDDGYQDLGVGAPYGGEDGSGVLYIYQGRMGGIKLEATQVISPKDLELNLTSFGAAVSGGVDVDGNAYPDVVIGAYQSDKAILLRSRPVISVFGSVQPEPAGLNLDEKNHELPGGQRVTKYSVKGCLRYNGTSTPTDQDINITITLDQTQPAGSRTVFLKTGDTTFQHTIRLNAGEDDVCVTEEAYIQNDVGDKISPLIITMTYKLIDKTDISLLPILNQNMLSSSSQAYFLNRCKNNICIPDLSIEATTQMDTVTIGDKNGLAINITVENKGDNAYSAVIKSPLAPGLGLIGIRRSDVTDIFIDCDFEDNQLLCDIGNPLPANKKINMMLFLSVDDLDGAEETLSVRLTAESLNKENNTLTDNNAVIAVSVKVSATIELKGLSIPEQVTFDEGQPLEDSQITESNIGPVVSHIYEVVNHGPSRVGKTEVEIRWPMKTMRGEYLFYLTEVTTNMDGHCVFSGEVDPLNLTVVENLPKYKDTNRYTRDVDSQIAEPIVAPSAQPNVNALTDCGTDLSGCMNITCSVNTIIGRASFVITLKSKLWVNTLLKNDIKETEATSYASARVLNMPYPIAPKIERKDSLEITTNVNPAVPTRGIGTVEIWIIIVSIIGGLLLLLLVAAILYKVGFFKRKTIPAEEGTSAETENFDGSNGAFE